MLETIRVFVAERLAARPDVAEVQRRHVGYYRALAEQADRSLRGAGQGEWLLRLQAEAGNLAAAVRWYLAHDPWPLPHLFRVLSALRRAPGSASGRRWPPSWTGTAPAPGRPEPWPCASR